MIFVAVIVAFAVVCFATDPERRRRHRARRDLERSQQRRRIHPPS